MQKKKLFSLLSALQSKELIAFKNFLERRYPETQIPIIVFDYLRKFHPEFKDETRLSQEAVHQKLFGEAQPHTKKMLNLYSDLYLDLCDFLLFKQVKKHTFESKLLWLSVLEEKQMKDAYIMEAEQFDKTIKARLPNTDSNYFENALLAQLRCYKTSTGKIEKDSLVVRHYDQTLDLLYAVTKLKTGCEIIALNRLHEQKMEESIMPIIQQICSKVELSAHPLLNLYLTVYNLLEHQTKPYFKQASTLFLAYLDKIDPKEMSKILEYLLQFCNVNVNRGLVKYRDYAWNLVKKSHKNKIFNHTGAISSTNFNNLVQIACRKGEFKWAEDFIHSQLKYLDERNNEDTVFMAKITLDFEKGLYDKVLAELEHKKFRKVSLVVRAKAYVLMCQYVLQSEKQDLDISSLCYTFEAYLRRYQRKYAIARRFMDFTKAVKMLSEKKESKETIQAYLQETQQITSREWLEKMLNDYKPEIWGGMER